MLPADPLAAYPVSSSIAPVESTAASPVDNRIFPLPPADPDDPVEIET